MAVSTLTPKLIASIAQHVELGAPQDVAAQAEDVKPKTLEKWVTVGRRHEEDDPRELSEHQAACVSLVGALARAHARFEVNALADMATAEQGGRDARPDVRPRQWVLERTRRERYGVKIEFVVKEKAMAELLAILQDGLTPEEFARVAEVIHGSEPSAGQDQGGDPDELA